MGFAVPYPLPNAMASPPRRSLLGNLVRQALGALSLAMGLALIGQCAAHTARAVLSEGGGPDLVLHCFKSALFTPFQHSASYQALFAAGAALSLMGIALMRIWAMAFFAFAAACFAAFGGMVAERVVVPRGPEALLLQHGCSGLWTIFTETPEGMGRDPLMILWIGFAALIPGLYLTHLHKAARPGGVARGPAARTSARAEGAPSFPVTPANPAEAGADTVADLDLSPDLETSEVHAPVEEGPDLPPLEEVSAPPEEHAGLETPAAGTQNAEPLPAPPPEESAPDPAPPDGPEEVPAEPRQEPEEMEAPPGKVLPAFALALGLLSTAPAALLLLAPSTVPSGWEAKALLAGVALGLLSLALTVLSGRMGARGWAAAGTAVAGLAGAGTLLAMGG